jgi:hypothetical protein
MVWRKETAFQKASARVTSLKQDLCLRRAPQQKLRTHCRLKAYCATLVMKMKRKMVSFIIFPSNGNDRGKPVPVTLCPPKIPHGVTRNRTRASAVGGRRLTAWAMAQPKTRLLWHLVKHTAYSYVSYWGLHAFRLQKDKLLWVTRKYVCPQP